MGENREKCIQIIMINSTFYVWILLSLRKWNLIIGLIARVQPRVAREHSKSFKILMYYIDRLGTYKAVYVMFQCNKDINGFLCICISLYQTIKKGAGTHPSLANHQFDASCRYVRVSPLSKRTCQCIITVNTLKNAIFAIKFPKHFQV
jgi:hypothetical protein